MVSPPEDLTQAALTEALMKGWSLRVASVEYRPVGFGSHHWEVLDGNGSCWFVTVDEPQELDPLRAALLTAPSTERFTIPCLAPDGSWDRGPFAAPMRSSLVDNASAIERLLARHDELVAEVRALPEPMVITHGEPHPGNTMLTADGCVLIDWDTALVAPREESWTNVSALVGRLST